MRPLVPSAGRLPEHAAAVAQGFTLPPGRTEREAIFTAQQHRSRIWKMAIPEDRKIDRLLVICIAICCGDAESGERLKTRAMYPC